MPGFVSHTVMAHDVYKQINHKNVDLNYMVTYSLGGDLCKYAKCRYDSHHKDMDRFIYVMADYIKKNDLTNNKEVMGLLYGHICHYVMDSVIHPLVRKVDWTCIRNKHNHMLIEVYYDNYLVNKIFNMSKKEYLKKNKLYRCHSEIKRVIDSVYLEVYHTKNVAVYYNFNLFLYRRLRDLYLLFSNSFINKIMGLDKFIRNNKIDLYNDDNKIKYRDYLGMNEDVGLIDLYNISVDVAVEYIENVNKYLNI